MTTIKLSNDKILFSHADLSDIEFTISQYVDDTSGIDLRNDDRRSEYDRRFKLIDGWEKEYTLIGSHSKYDDSLTINNVNYCRLQITAKVIAGKVSKIIYEADREDSNKYCGTALTGSAYQYLRSRVDEALSAYVEDHSLELVYNTKSTVIQALTEDLEQRKNNIESALEYIESKKQEHVVKATLKYLKSQYNSNKVNQITCRELFLWVTNDSHFYKTVTVLARKLKTKPDLNSEASKTGYLIGQLRTVVKDGVKKYMTENCSRQDKIQDLVNSSELQYLQYLVFDYYSDPSQELFFDN